MSTPELKPLFFFFFFSFLNENSSVCGCSLERLSSAEASVKTVLERDTSVPWAFSSVNAIIRGISRRDGGMDGGMDGGTDGWREGGRP